MGQVLGQNHFICEGENIKGKAIIISKTEMLNEETKYRPSFTFLLCEQTTQLS